MHYLNKGDNMHKKESSGQPHDNDSVKENEEALKEESTSGGQDSVKYETYRKTLGEAKKAKAERDELMQRLQELEQGKLQAEGKKDELIESLRKEASEYKNKYSEAVGSFARGRALDAIVDEAVREGCSSTGLLRKVVSDKLADLDFDDEFKPNMEQVKLVIDEIKKTEPILFSKQAPKVSSHNLNPQSVSSNKKSLSSLKEDELMQEFAKTLQQEG